MQTDTTHSTGVRDKRKGEISGRCREGDGLHERFVHWIAHNEPRERALACMRGLLVLLGRGNDWTVAEEADHGGPGRMQRPLKACDCDTDEHSAPVPAG